MFTFVHNKKIIEDKSMKATYIKTQPKSVVNITKIASIHYFEFGKNFVFDGESHDFWEMVYIDSGKVRIRCDEDEITLTQGEIIFHRPNEFHAIRALDSAPNFFVISFVCNSPAMQCFERYHTSLDNTLKTFISSIIRESDNTYIIPKNDPSFYPLVKKNADIGGEQLIKTYLEQLLIFLLRKMTKKGQSDVFPAKEEMENHLVIAIKKQIQDKVEERFHVSDICSALGYSKSYLSKIFREQTGYTIASYSLKVKIKRAKQLIRDNDMNFTQISDTLAFDNPQYFSRVFKRITGMTPSEFKLSLDRSHTEEK